MALTALFLTGDLLFSSRVVGAAESASLKVEVVGSADAARQRAGADDVGLLIVDLTMPGCRPNALMEVWTTLPSPPPVIAYGPHVAETQLQAARDAGCAEVLTRGQFDRQMRDVLVRYLADKRAE